MLWCESWILGIECVNSIFDLPLLLPVSSSLHCPLLIFLSSYLLVSWVFFLLDKSTCNQTMGHENKQDEIRVDRIVWRDNCIDDVKWCGVEWREEKSKGDRKRYEKKEEERRTEGKKEKGRGWVRQGREWGNLSLYHLSFLKFFGLKYHLL